MSPLPPPRGDTPGSRDPSQASASSCTGGASRFISQEDTSAGGTRDRPCVPGALWGPWLCPDGTPARPVGVRAVCLTLPSESENRGGGSPSGMNNEFLPLLSDCLWDYYHLSAPQAQLGTPSIDQGLLCTHLTKKEIPP